MSKHVNQSGSKKHHIFLLKYIGNDTNFKPIYEAKCDCGTIFQVKYESWKSGHTKSCGCQYHLKIKRMTKFVGKIVGDIKIVKIIDIPNGIFECLNTHTQEIFNQSYSYVYQLFYYANRGCISSKKLNIIGKQYGYLKILSVNRREKKNKKLYLNCLCLNCNSECVTLYHNVLQGNSTSCGCIKREINQKAGKQLQKWMMIPENKEKCFKASRESLYVKEGVNRSNYNHNLTKQEREINRRRFPGYQTWCCAVYKKYNYTCQKCGAYNKQMQERGGLVAHHILSFKDYPDKRLDVENGICLCNQCHVDFHVKYTNIHFTPENLEEFLKHP